MLKGKIAIVTGASRGIGRAIALKMAQNGADVAVIYAGNQQAAKQTAQMIQETGRKCSLYQCDVSNFNEVAQTVQAIYTDFGRVDILVNNAGIVHDALVLSMKEEDFDRVVATNLKGAFHMIKHTFKPFMKQRSGAIINITSVVGLTGNASQANYAAAKAGLIGLTKSVAKELAARGVTCNAIAPGFIETEMTGALSESVQQQLKQNIPVKRPGRAEDVADAAVFLASDMASYITGEVLKVDGGMCM